MSRVGKKAIVLPSGVEVVVTDSDVAIKGPLGRLVQPLNGMVKVIFSDGVLKFEPASDSRESNAMTGTLRALVSNMVVGVTKGFEKKLILVGVGYKAQVQGGSLNLSLGFSHPVERKMPDGIKCEVPIPTEIFIKGIDRQKVGQVAAEIRSYREPEPYKGKGVRYDGEVIVLKETKKK